MLFVDGSNWFHALVDAGVGKRGNLSIAKVSEKLVGPRDWIETRYYIGQVRNDHNTELYNQQRAYLQFIQSCDSRISVHLGRLEARPVENETAQRLRRYLANLPSRLDSRVYRELSTIAQDGSGTTVMVEKAVDVNLAVDLVVKAERNEYDAAYMLTADGDFTPAVDAVRALGKKVFAASPGYGAQLAGSVNAFIRMKPDWFTDCYGM
jgi:uncharacterized LabA/DUF88 family protein